MGIIGRTANTNLVSRPRQGIIGRTANTNLINRPGIIGRTANTNLVEGPSIQQIMAQSGSTDPSDPYNWRGIAAALAAQGDPNYASHPDYVARGGSSGGGGGNQGSYATGDIGGTPNVSPPPAPPSPPPVTPVFESPVTYTAPPVYEPPKGVTTGAEGAAGAPSGQTFNAFGGGLTAGMFDRLRKQRTPRAGLSVTPEMLQAAARARLG